MFVFQIENFLSIFLNPLCPQCCRAKLAMHSQTSKVVLPQLLGQGWSGVGCGLATSRFLGSAGGRSAMVGPCSSGATHRPPRTDPAPPAPTPPPPARGLVGNAGPPGDS